MKGVKSGELEKGKRLEIQLVKSYRRRLKAIKDNLDFLHPQHGIEIYTNANDMTEKLYSLLGSRAAGNTSDDVRNEARFVIQE